MQKIKVTHLNLLLLLPIIVSIFCVSFTKLDSNGNPIFNSITILDTTINNKGVEVGYYTIANNINNPKSSVFVSKSPTEDDIWDFVLEKPSYFFIVHQDRVVEKMAILIRVNKGEKKVWKYQVVKDNNEIMIDAGVGGSITEHRFMEMSGKLNDPDYKFLEGKGGIGIPNHKRMFYRVFSFESLIEDFKSKVM